MRKTGKICSKHPQLRGVRYVVNGNCVKCHQEHNSSRRRIRYAADVEYRGRLIHRAVKQLKMKPELRRIASNKSYAKNKLKYKPRERAQNRLRRAALQQAKPKWMPWGLVAEKYAEIKSQGLSVDHIVPLKGELVCGLHVPWNLCGISLIENIKKGNKHVA